MRACKTYFSQAFSNLWRNRFISLMATFTIVFCLLLLGISLILGFNISYVSRQLEGQYEIHAYVDLAYTEEQAAAITEKIQSIEYVDTATFITKAQALEDMKENMEDSAAAFEMLEGDENPLPHSFEVTLTDVRHANEVVNAIKQIEGIEDVKNRSDVLNKIIKTSRGAQMVSIIGMLIFSFAGVFIISYTIKMSVAARSTEIEIMKYVGAKDSYISWPFIIEGTIMGVVGALIGFFPVCIVYGNIVKWWKDTVSVFSLVPVAEIKNIVLIVFIVMGCLLGAFGSIISIRKHLRV